MPRKTSSSSAVKSFPSDPLQSKSTTKQKRSSPSGESGDVATLSSAVQSEKNTKPSEISGNRELNRTNSSAATEPHSKLIDKPAKQKRFSLQQEHGRTTTSSVSASPRRNTVQINSNSSPKGRRNLKKSTSLLETAIAEDEIVGEVRSKPPIKNNEAATFTIEEERKSSKSRPNGGLAASSYNENFHKFSRNDSVNNSIKSSASKLGSVQSLEVVREQYCCFQRKTKLERILSFLVFVLSVTVIILIVVIIFIAKHKSFDNLKEILK